MGRQVLTAGWNPGLRGCGLSRDPDHISTSPSLSPCQVLENQGMPMDDDQYAQLTAAIGYKKEGMNYLDLAAGFEGSSLPRANPASASPWWHHSLSEP